MFKNWFKLFALHVMVYPIYFTAYVKCPEANQVNIFDLDKCQLKVAF